MLTIIMYVIGMMVGCLITRLLTKTKPSGNLRIDHSDPNDRPYLFLELSQPVEVISKRKIVTLNVRVEDFIPHE